MKFKKRMKLHKAIRKVLQMKKCTGISKIINKNNTEKGLHV